MRLGIESRVVKRRRSSRPSGYAQRCCQHEDGEKAPCFESAHGRLADPSMGTIPHLRGKTPEAGRGPGALVPGRTEAELKSLASVSNGLAFLCHAIVR